MSDLAGRLGSLTHGYYERSVNMAVKSGTGIRKRRGFVRAVDELLVEGGVLATLRDKESKHRIAVDGEGVKVLTTLPSIPQQGDGYSDAGYPNDDFNRTSSSLSDSTTDPPQAWLENLGTNPLGGQWQTYDDSYAALKSLGVQKEGTFDRGDQAPGPLYVVRMELDFQTFDPASLSEDQLNLFIGLPPDLVVDGTAYNSRVYSSDPVPTGIEGNSSVNGTMPWTGIGLLMAFNKNATASTYSWRCRMMEYLSSERSGTGATLTGASHLSDSDYGTGLSAATLQQSHVVEFGRIPTGEPGVWKNRAYVWYGKTLSSLQDTDVPDLSLGSGTVYVDKQVSGDYIVLPYGEAGRGGGFGVHGKSKGGASSQLRVEEVATAAAFTGNRQ